MKKIIAITAIFLLGLCFLHSGIFKQLNDRRADQDKYVPRKDWTGLETTDYSLWNREIIAGMMTGTPDPVPDQIIEEAAKADLSAIVCKTDCDRISMRETAEITVTLTHTAEEGAAVPVYRIPNIERWNGTEWERLIYLPVQPSMDGVEPIVILMPGETVSVSLRLAESVTRLTVGKYRAVVYIGYENDNTSYAKCYAEFELTE